MKTTVCKTQRTAGVNTVYMSGMMVISAVTMTSCKKETTEEILPQAGDNARYTITQNLSDEAQRNTIAFDALGFMTGTFGSQTFLPPGKVADYSGFQYLRDNDPTSLAQYRFRDDYRTEHPDL